MKQLVIFLLFLGVAKINFCISQTIQLNAISLPNLDTTFLAIINNHLDEMKVDGLFNPVDSFMIIYINPSLDESSVPERIIDSLYKSSNFPLSAGAQSYNLVVMSLSADCQIFNSVKNYKYRYYAKVNTYHVFIVSVLNIRVRNSKEKISITVCSGDSCDKSCDDDLEKVTTYIYHPDEIIQTKFKDIWLRNNTLNNHPKEILHINDQIK